MKRLRTALIVTAALLIAAAGFILPSVIFSVQDKRIEKNVEIAEIGEIDLSLSSDLSMAQRMALTSSVARSISLETGRFMDAEEAAACAAQEFSKAGASFGFDIILEKYTPECSACLKMDEKGKSIVLWNASYSLDNCELTLSIDDETGKIVAFELHGYPDAYPPESYDTDVDPVDIYDAIYVLTEGLVRDYLGLDFTDILLSGYSAEVSLIDGSKSVNLYQIPISVFPWNPDIYFNINR